MATFETFSQVVDAFGIGALAQLLGVEESHIRTMKARNSIPPEYWGVIIEAAPSREIEGLTFAALREMRTARFTDAGAA